MIVESRAAADELTKLPVDLSSLTNLNRMANTPDPRDFYRISRVVLVPSLTENAASVAREALANGIPVLASQAPPWPDPATSAEPRPFFTVLVMLPSRSSQKLFLPMSRKMIRPVHDAKWSHRFSELGKTAHIVL